MIHNVTLNDYGKVSYIMHSIINHNVHNIYRH